MIFLDVFNEFEEENNDEDSGEEDVPLLSQTFIDIMKEQPNSTPVILACGPGQASFEDSKLENGLFAHAIFDALSNENRHIIDINHNNVITIEEFYIQLQRGIRSYSTNNNPQMPYLDEFYIGQDFTILQVSSYRE